MKRLISLMLCLVLAASLAINVQAEEDFQVGQTWDMDILAGGIYDLFAWVGDEPENYTFQWQVDVALGDGSWIDLEDNASPYGYEGTDTYHMRLITDFGKGFVYGSGWEEIPFRCVITDKRTGLTKRTASIIMTIFASDDLQEYLEKQGFGLYEPTVKGSTKLVTGDDVNYTGNAFAGTKLELMCGCWRPSSEHLLRRSDFTESVEIWITENGKTVKTTDHTAYTPYTIGKDAVTIQFKLHHKLGVHDLGYYETKTVRLNVREPDAVAYGTSKYQVSLLKERYNESAKLATIPQGASLKITEASGGWYQVLYDGYIGYVASSCVNIVQAQARIDHVDVKITEPLAGSVAATTATVAPDSCSVKSVEWIDLTEERFLEAGERFQKDHSYQLVLWVTAAEGCKFKLDADEKICTTAVINGDLPAFTSQAYEQIIGQVIDIRYDFNNVQETNKRHKCEPSRVDRVEPTCTEPGREMYYVCSCGKTYADAAATQEVYLNSWGILPANGHTEGNWGGNGTHHYKKCTVCRAVITGTNAPHTGGIATCQQKATCEICAMQYGQIADHKWTKTPSYQESAGHAYACEYLFCTAHGELTPHVPGPEATETQPQKCTVCSYIINPAKGHTHSLSKVPARAANCMVPGSVEHYRCSGCSQLFADQTGTNRIQNPVIAPLGHTASDAWGCDESFHWRVCTVCNTVMEETKMLHEPGGEACPTCGYRLEAENTYPTMPAPTEPKPTEAEPDPTGEEDLQGSDTPLPYWLLFVLIGLGSCGLGIVIVLLFYKRKGEKHEK